jgi:hypothetical protein
MPLLGTCVPYLPLPNLLHSFHHSGLCGYLLFKLSLQEVVQRNRPMNLSKFSRVNSRFPSSHSVLHPLDVAPSNAVSGNESHLRFVQNQSAGFVESNAKEFWVFE